MKEKPSPPLLRCPTCRAVILGDELDRRTNQCPFCLPMPADSQQDIPAAAPEDPRRNRRE